MDELTDLQTALGRLTQRRRNIIKSAERMVKRANAEFDREAMPLMRKVAELRTTQAAAAPRPQRRPVVLDGLTEEEQQHYHELERKQHGQHA